jgi:cytochrome bd-type quinol oxidase subunit 2
MENPQNLPPSLIIFVFVSLILCIWAIVDIARSAFTKLNKLMWLLIVLFAPFGIFIYLFIGRRLKPVSRAPAPDNKPGGEVRTSREPEGSLPHRNVTWPFLATLAATAVLCVITYVNVVSVLGREKTAWILISAMVIVGMILAFLQLRRGRKG